MAIEGYEEEIETGGQDTIPKVVSETEMKPMPTMLESVEPDNMEVIGAMFRQYNSIYQTRKAHAIGRATGDSDISDEEKKARIAAQSSPFSYFYMNPRLVDEKDPNFDLDQSLSDAQIEGKDRDYFDGVKNQQQFRNALEYYYQDKADEELLSNVSFTKAIACGLVAGAADPLNWIPVGRALKLGSSIVRAGTEAAVLGGVNYSIRSTANNNFSMRELAEETAASGIAAGLLTYGGRGILKGLKNIKESTTYQNTKAAFKDMLRPNISRWFEMEDGELVEVSEGVFGQVKQKAKRAIWTLVNNCPAEQMYNSGDELLQKLSGRIFRNRVSNLRGDEVAGVTVEEALNLYEGESLALSEKVNKLRNSFVERGGTPEEFNKSVGKLIVNGNAPDQNTEIGKSVKMILDFDAKIISEAEKYGALDEGFLSSGISTERDVVDAAMMKKTREEFEKEVTSDQITRSKITAVNHIVRKYNQKAIDERTSEISEIIDREVFLNNPTLSKEEIANIRNSIVAKISGRTVEANSGAFAEVPFKAQVLAQRKVAIHDDLLIDLGILDYDPVLNHKNALRQVVVDTELNKVAQELNYKSWDELKKSAEKTGNQKVGELLNAKGEAVADANSAAFNYNLKLLQDTEALLKGTFSKNGYFQNNRVLQWLADTKELEFASMAGMLALSMIPDVSNLILRTGGKRLGKRFIFPQASLKKADKETLTQFLGFLDSAIRKNRFRDVGYTPDYTSDLSRVASKVATFETKYTGVDLLNQILKETAAEEIYSQLIEKCIKGTDTKWLNKMGITDAFRKEILYTYERYGDKYKNIFYVDPNYFQNDDLARQIKASVVSLVDQTILTPGAGDVPRFLRSQIGQFLYMFTSYGYLVWNDLMKPLFRGDIGKSKYMPAIAVGLTLSAIRKYVADFVNGRETDPSTSDFWEEVVGYSSVGNFITDAAMTADRALSSRSTVSAVSPTAAWIDNFVGSIRDLTHGRFTRRVRNSVPGLNFWYLRPLSNDITQSSKRQGRVL